MENKYQKVIQVSSDEYSNFLCIEFNTLLYISFKF
jgi:D-hexose-6-phosphate mutarotase